MKNNKTMLGIAFSLMSFGLYADFEPDFTDQQLPLINIQEIISEVKELLKPQIHVANPSVPVSAPITQEPAALVPAALNHAIQADVTPSSLGNESPSSSINGVSKPTHSSVVERISYDPQEFLGYSSSLSDKPNVYVDSGKSDYRAVFAIVAITSSFLLYKLLYSSKP